VSSIGRRLSETWQLKGRAVACLDRRIRASRWRCFWEDGYRPRFALTGGSGVRLGALIGAEASAMRQLDGDTIREAPSDSKKFSSSLTARRCRKCSRQQPSHTGSFADNRCTVMPIGSEEPSAPTGDAPTTENVGKWLNRVERPGRPRVGIPPSRPLTQKPAALSRARDPTPRLSASPSASSVAGSGCRQNGVNR
jgi:hypothetical protein